jgi:hypothetical protein
MPESHERSESLECMTEPEILSAIRYLDPDLEPRTGHDAGTVSGICITLLTTLTGVLTYICLYFWRL